MRSSIARLFPPLVLAVAACSSNTATTPAAIPSCPPIPFPTRNVFLAYPAPSATSVAVNIGSLVIYEVGNEGFESDTIALVKTSGTQQTPVTKGTPGPAPSPLPSPLATGNATGAQTYFGYPVPALSPGTTYTVSDTYVFGIESPRCQSAITNELGSFTTQ